MKKKTGSRIGLRHAAFALLVAYGSRIAWWSSEFDPLMLLTYGIMVFAVVAIFVVFHELAEAREHESGLSPGDEHDDALPPQH